MEMHFKQYLLFALIFTVLFLTTNCTKDNEPPNTPLLYSPVDNDTSISTMPTLIWSACPDPENDSVTYDIYLGTSNPPALVKSNWTSNTFSPVNLDHLRKYYWQIVAKDIKNSTTASPVWSFTTLDFGEIEVFVCDATQKNYFGGAEVFLYLSDLERSNDSKRTNYYQKNITDIIDPINIGAVFYRTPQQKYYFFARMETAIGSGNFLTGVGDCYAQDGKITKLTVKVQ